MIRSFSGKAKWGGKCTVVSCIVLWAPVIWPLSSLRSEDGLALGSAVLKYVKYPIRCLIWLYVPTMISRLAMFQIINQPVALLGRKTLECGSSSAGAQAWGSGGRGIGTAKLVYKGRSPFWDKWAIRAMFHLERSRSLAASWFPTIAHMPSL